MDTIIGAFDAVYDARRAIDRLIGAGFDPVTELEMISHQSIAEDYAEIEQRPTPGSVNSLGSPTPPAADPTLSAGPLGQAYFQDGSKGLINALMRAGVGEDRAHQFASQIEGGGALVAVYEEDRKKEAARLLKEGRAVLLA